MITSNGGIAPLGSNTCRGWVLKLVGDVGVVLSTGNVVVIKEGILYIGSEVQNNLNSIMPQT
jgi:hypothetical protein